MDGRGDGALAMGDQLPLGHPLATTDRGCGRRADVLLQGHVQQGRQGQLHDGLPGGERLAVGGVDAAADLEESHVLTLASRAGPRCPTIPSGARGPPAAL